MRYLDDGCDELLQECVFEQRRPVVVEKVDEKSFDVGAVLVLQRHTHAHTHWTVSRRVFIHLGVSE